MDKSLRLNFASRMLDRIVFWLLVIVWCLIPQGVSAKEAIHIAIVSSETGDLAEIGKDMSRGVILAFDEANEAAALKDKEIVYHIFDDQGDPKVAVNVAQRVLSDNRIVGIVGHLTSGCMSAAAPVYARAGIPVVMPVPTNPKITSHGYRNLFRVPPTDKDQAPFLAKYLLEHYSKAPTAIVNDLTAYGVGFAGSFKDTFVKGGGNLVTFEGIQKGVRDFRTLIAKLKSLRPQFVVVGATYDMGAPFVRQMRELGLTATVLGGDGMYGSEFLKQAGDSAEGAILSFIAPDRGSSSKTDHFFLRFERRYGKVVSFAPLGYDAGQVLIAAVAKSNKVDRGALVRTIRSQDFEVEGVTGKIQFAENGDNKNKNLSLYIVRHGKYQLLK